jgi:hypothetical protein
MSPMWDDDDKDCAPDVRTFRTGTATARKQHKCTGCDSGYIAPGDRYSFFVGLLEGEFIVDRMCLPGAKTPCCDHTVYSSSKPAPPVYGPDEMPF